MVKRGKFGEILGIDYFCIDLRSLSSGHPEIKREDAIIIVSELAGITKTEATTYISQLQGHKINWHGNRLFYVPREIKALIEKLEEELKKPGLEEIVYKEDKEESAGKNSSTTDIPNIESSAQQKQNPEIFRRRRGSYLVPSAPERQLPKKKKKMTIEERIEESKEGNDARVYSLTEAQSFLLFNYGIKIPESELERIVKKYNLLAEGGKLFDKTLKLAVEAGYFDGHFLNKQEKREIELRLVESFLNSKPYELPASVKNWRSALDYIFSCHGSNTRFGIVQKTLKEAGLYPATTKEEAILSSYFNKKKVASYFIECGIENVTKKDAFTILNYFGYDYPENFFKCYQKEHGVELFKDSSEINIGDFLNCMIEIDGDVIKRINRHDIRKLLDSLKQTKQPLNNCRSY